MKKINIFRTAPVPAALATRPQPTVASLDSGLGQADPAPNLRPTQRRRLVKLLLKRPLAHGYRTNLWTTARIAEVIGRESGVDCHCAHVGRRMHCLRWTHQKPETRPLRASPVSC
jgi:transposase